MIYNVIFLILTLLSIISAIGFGHFDSHTPPPQFVISSLLLILSVVLIFFKKSLFF